MYVESQPGENAALSNTEDCKTSKSAARSQRDVCVRRTEADGDSGAEGLDECHDEGEETEELRARTGRGGSQRGVPTSAFTAKIGSRSQKLTHEGKDRDRLARANPFVDLCDI